MKDLVLGVDGGNTKTIALVSKLDGAVIGAGKAGCADIYGAASFDAAVAEITRAVVAALPEGASLANVGTAVFSLAGADWEEDKADLHRALVERLPRASITVVNDAIGALRAGTNDGVGVSVVVGTGGCVGAVGPGGDEWHSSWWALHTGAWAMGGDALEAVYAAELGIGDPTSLTIAALETYSEPTVEGVLHAFTRRDGRSPWDAALLAPAVLEAVGEGDAVAAAIVRAHGAKLGDIARLGALKVGLEPPFPLVLLGGVLRGDAAGPFVSEIVARVPGAEPVRPDREPAVGALLMALDRSGAAFDAAVLDATTPDRAFFGAGADR